MSLHIEKKDDFELTLDQIKLTNSSVTTRSISINGKMRFRRRISNNSALKHFANNNSGKYVT